MKAQLKISVLVLLTIIVAFSIYYIVVHRDQESWTSSTNALNENHHNMRISQPSRNDLGEGKSSEKIDRGSSSSSEWRPSQNEITASNVAAHIMDGSSIFPKIVEGLEADKMLFKGLGNKTEGIARFNLSDKFIASAVGNSVRITLIGESPLTQPIKIGYVYSDANEGSWGPLLLSDDGMSGSLVLPSPATFADIEDGAKYVAQGLFNGELSDVGHSGLGVVPAGWALSHRLGGPLRRASLGYSSVDEEPGNLAFGNYFDESGVWGISKRFKVGQMQPVTIRVTFKSKNLQIPKSVRRDQQFETLMAEDDMILQMRWYDSDHIEIPVAKRDSWSDTASQIKYDNISNAQNLSNSWQDFEWVFSPPDLANYFDLIVHAVDGDNKVVPFDHVAGNASVLIDKVDVITAGSYFDMTALPSERPALVLQIEDDAELELRKIVIQSKQ